MSDFKDLERAIASLDGHALCLCKGEEMITSDESGIKKLVELTKEKGCFSGFCVADVIVGRAAAMLMYRAGIIAVYGRVLSKGAKQFLEGKGVYTRYETLTEMIVNRKGDDMCPMEKEVSHTSNPDTAFLLLARRVSRSDSNINPSGSFNLSPPVN